MEPLQLDPSRQQALLDWCDQLQSPGLPTPGDCQRQLQTWAAGGQQVRRLGFSQAGRPLECLVWGPPEGAAVVAYGYPHPDEPTGAATTLALGQALLQHGPPPGLEGVCWYLLPCADPDQASVNVPWIREPELEHYVHGHWRPLYQGLEVDYAFPIDHGPLLQPPNWAPPGWSRPLPESLALAGLLQQTRPRLLATLHANHASGVYSFLSHRPGRELVEAMDSSTRRYGLAPHWGERPDPGRRWIQARPDLLRERRIADRVRQLERLVGELGAGRYAGCVSVAMYLESLDPQTVVLTPEVGLWQPEQIDNSQPSTEQRQVWISVERTRRGLREIWRGALRLPDGSSRTVCYAIRPTAAARAVEARVHQLPLTRGMAGVEAVERRRWWLGQADRIWQHWQNQVDEHGRFQYERRAIRVPAAAVNDRSMLIFRTAEPYTRIATQAQCQDLRLRWTLQDCLWLGHGVQLYAEAGLEAATQQQELLLRSALQQLGPLQPVPVIDAVRSQAARTLLVAAATPGLG